jgi:hypothetical protein
VTKDTTPKTIAPRFIKGAKSVDQKLYPKTPTRAPKPKTATDDRPLFLHLQYHPLEIPNSNIHQAFEEFCPKIRAQLHVKRFAPDSQTSGTYFVRRRWMNQQVPEHPTTSCSCVAYHYQN